MRSSAAACLSEHPTAMAMALVVAFLACAVDLHSTRWFTSALLVQAAAVLLVAVRPDDVRLAVELIIYVLVGFAAVIPANPRMLPHGGGFSPGDLA